MLNFINVIGQIFFIDTFLDGEFSTYGMRVFEYSGLEFEDRPDPMAVVFPKVTKCTFHKYGPSGTVQLHDGLCVLPTNIINEKIYIFLWLWLVSLSVVTGAFLIYRIAVILGPQIRVALIAVKVSYSYKNHYRFCHILALCFVQSTIIQIITILLGRKINQTSGSRSHLGTTILELLRATWRLACPSSRLQESQCTSHQ